MERVNVLSETQQEFRGKIYYLCDKYFQNGGERLHRTVWEYHNGSIPDGYCIHHKEGKHLNQIENLELMESTAHSSLHNKGHDRSITKAALDAAAEWHRGAEGIEWHRKHYENTKEALHKKVLRVCANCNAETFSNKKTGNVFCCNNCKSAFRRKSGIVTITKICEICGSLYHTNKHAGKYSKTCSRQCRYKLRVKRTESRRITF